MYRLSLIIPCFNEERILERNLRRVISALDRSGMRFEVIVSNDGSSDRSGTIVREMAGEDLRIRVVDNQIHRGKGAALTDGFFASRYEVLAFIDADLEIDIGHLFPLMERVRNGEDIAIGSKTLDGSAQRRPLKRRAATWGFNFLVRCILGSQLSDHQTGIKVFRRQVLLPILAQVRSQGWTWDTEVLIHGQRLGLTIAEVPVETKCQRASNVSIVRHSLLVFREIFHLYRRGMRLKEKDPPESPREASVAISDEQAER